MYVETASGLRGILLTLAGAGVPVLAMVVTGIWVNRSRRSQRPPSTPPGQWPTPPPPGQWPPGCRTVGGDE